MRFPIYVVLSCSMVMLARVPEAAPTDGAVTGTVRFLRDGKEVPYDGYVYLVPMKRGRPMPPRPTTATIAQKEKRFTPNVVVVPVGSTVAFPNREPRSSPDNVHQVFSPTIPAPFALSRYGSGASKSRKFLDEGEFDIYCDIHAGMSAKVKVVDTNHIVPVTKGTFNLTGIPAGRYRVVAWAPDSEESKDSITVAAGETAQVPRLTVMLGNPKPHRRKQYSRSIYNVKD